MARLLCKFLLWLAGWKVDRSFPADARRCVMVAAPHTSNWDAYYLRLAFTVLDVPMKVAIKDNWTKSAVGFFIKALGGVGINRGPKVGSKRKSQTDMMAELFDRYDDIALVISPEGTRTATDIWRKGFYYVALQAHVPITLGYLDYKKKIAGVMSEVIYPEEHQLDDDMKKILRLYSKIQGANPENFKPDKRFSG